MLGSILCKVKGHTWGEPQQYAGSIRFYIIPCKTCNKKVYYDHQKRKAYHDDEVILFELMIELLNSARNKKVAKMVTTTTWWVTLGVQQQSTQSEVKTAYRKLALLHHPDRGGDSERFKVISKAYEDYCKTVKA